MSTDVDTDSIPDVADRHRRLIAFAVLALGARYGISASAFLVDAGLASALGLLADGLTLLAVGLIVPVFVWKGRNRSRDDWHLYEDDDGFVARTIARAHAGSWTLTFIVLILTESMDRTLGDLSWVFLFDVVLAVMLLSFSLIFLYLDRAPPASGSVGAGDA